MSEGGFALLLAGLVVALLAWGFWWGDCLQCMAVTGSLTSRRE